ncbi:portal protein [Stenotrophomonas phage c9-N]|uniref:Portal protein n=1 Tax=Stenotrophomonas phage vB_SmeS_BUCT700 TaxID=2924895 RepID=A0AAE9K6Z4_9CAUD|nr:portal protein [Stenotrophomonas phage vB_SmeS_BUCT700]UNY50278.1 portal protein [Stenotrophomonas phage vB_SmeS_BUCT703]WKC56421.1 portal protein [Stenotrophomonas phage c9-N]
MNIANTAPQRWARLDGVRGNIIRRAERYAKWTIAKIFPDSWYDGNNGTVSNEWQSLGAQAVNHLSNRLMQTLFAPSRPFFRLGPKKAAKEAMATIGPEQQGELENKLSVVEREAADVVDKLSLRTKLYELLKLLIVTGNALMILRDGTMRILNMRSYVVRRDLDGKVIELMIRERVQREEIDPEALAMAERSGQFMLETDGMTTRYRWIKYDPITKKYNESQWLDKFQLPAKWSSSYSEERMPYRAVTWDLSSGMHYGTGLVEDYKGDFAALAALSRSTINAAIMNSEFRWLLRAGVMTSAQDLANSRNGDVLYGEPGDITPLPSGMEAKLDVNITVVQEYVQRIGAGFMLQSAVTRQAERVTTVELRMNAEELEGGLGGAYSRLAGDLQIPMATFCLENSGYSLKNSQWEATVITGLAALSRVGDRDRLNSFLQSIMPLIQANPNAVIPRLRIGALISDMASAEGIDRNKYVLSDAEFQQQQAMEQQQALMQQAAAGAIDQEMNA